MSHPDDRTFTGDFRRFFLRGLVVLLPSVLTLWIVVKAYQFVDNTIAEPINRGVRLSLVQSARVWQPLRSTFDPSEQAIDKAMSQLLLDGESVPPRAEVVAELRAEAVNTWWRERWYMDLIGIIVAIVSVYIAGRLLGGLIGRRIYRRLERLITSVPVVKQVYPYVKQVVDFLFSDDSPMEFNRVVAVEYPRKGLWSVGFVTGDSLRTLRESSGKAVSVFIPSSPTPFTGYTITVPVEELIEMPISVEEAIRFAISAGVLIPDHQIPPGSSEAQPGKSGLIPLPKPGGAPARDDHPPASRNAG